MGSVCSRNSLQARDQIQTRLRAGLINSVTREEENIVVYESSSQERKCLSPRSLSKSVKFQFQSPDESVPSPSSARKISILKNHQSVCDTQECCAAPQTVIPDSCSSSPPPPGVSSLVQTR